jgi:hypothetical protein
MARSSNSRKETSSESEVVPITDIVDGSVVVDGTIEEVHIHSGRSRMLVAIDRSAHLRIDEGIPGAVREIAPGIRAHDLGEHAILSLVSYTPDGQIAGFETRPMSGELIELVPRDTPLQRAA